MSADKWLAPVRPGWQRATVDFDIRVKRVHSVTLEVCADFSYEAQDYDLNYAYLEEVLITREVLEALVPTEDLIRNLETNAFRRPPKDHTDDER